MPTVQVVVRHANANVTMNSYLHAVTPAKSKRQAAWWNRLPVEAWAFMAGIAICNTLLAVPIVKTVDIAILPAVSSDGKMLAYHDIQVDGNSGLRIMSMKSGTELKWFDIDTVTTRWTPDNRSLLYVKNENGVSNICSQPISRGRARQVTHVTSDLIRSFDLSPDGKQLVTNRCIANRDVRLIHEMR